MDSSKLKLVAVLFISACLAVYLGMAAATAQTEVLAWVGGGLFLALCVLLGKHIWILIPATLGMQGGLNFIPGSPAPWQLMTAVVGGFTLLRVAIRQQRIYIRWTGIETAMLLVALTILQAFIRNPTGLSVLGGSVSGGKPYIVFAIAFAAYFLISTADADIRSWRWAVGSFIALAFVDQTISVLSAIYPEFAQVMIRYSSNVSLEASRAIEYSVNTRDQRISELGHLGLLLGLIAVSFWRPLGALNFTKPWRAAIAMGAVVSVVLSGFRNFAALLFIYFAISSVWRRKVADVLAVVSIGVVAFSIISVAVPVTSLPFGFQRIMAPIPGVKVRSDVKKDAEASNEFRFEMWKLALTTDRYIKHKLLGDGFQYSADEMKAREGLMYGDYRMAGGMTTEEMFMATGSYHGFHAETIRFTGAVGLAAATGLLIVGAVYATRCIRRSRNDPSFGHVLFVCIPFVVYPWWYWLVFGEYRGQFAVFVATIGMIKLLDGIQRRSSDQANSVAIS